MYELVRSALDSPRVAAHVVVSLLTALVIAELFYKLGSFVLEAVAFLVTWFVLDLVAAKLDARR